MWKLIIIFTLLTQGGSLVSHTYRIEGLKTEAACHEMGVKVEALIRADMKISPEELTLRCERD